MTYDRNSKLVRKTLGTCNVHLAEGIYTLTQLKEIITNMESVNRAARESIIETPQTSSVVSGGKESQKWTTE